MRNLHIDKNTPNLLHYAFDSNSSHICQDIITWFKQGHGLESHLTEGLDVVVETPGFVYYTTAAPL